MENLRIPGPTPLPPEVLKALGRQMVNHRGPEFRKILGKVTENLKQIYQTKNDVVVLTGSGTGGMEAAIVNMLSPGDRVLALPNGSFGERFVSLTAKFGVDVVPLKFEWGKAVDPDAVSKALQADPKIKAVIATHNETSTGVTNDLAAISAAVKGAGKLLIVDAISSLGCIDLPVDEWKIDVTITCSQKGLMAPPGLAMVAVSPEAWQANASAKLPRFYWDFARAKKSAENAETPWTPAVAAFFALDVSLDMILKEGLQNVFARHARVAEATRNGVKSLGLSLFADERFASNSVTAVNVSNGLDVKKMSRTLREEHGVVVAGGQSSLEGKIFRIGHLGWVDVADIEGVVAALKVVLPKCGFQRPL